MTKDRTASSNEGRQFGTDDHILLLVCHHIVTDGWSVGVFELELSLLYYSLRRNTAPALAKVAAICNTPIMPFGNAAGLGRGAGFSALLLEGDARSGAGARTPNGYTAAREPELFGRAARFGCRRALLLACGVQPARARDPYL